MEPSPANAAMTWSSLTPQQQHNSQAYQHYAASLNQLGAVSNSLSSSTGIQSNQNHTTHSNQNQYNRTRILHLTIEPEPYNRTRIIQHTIEPESYNQLHVASTEWRVSHSYASVYKMPVNFVYQHSGKLTSDKVYIESHKFSSTCK